MSQIKAQTVASMYRARAIYMSTCNTLLPSPITTNQSSMCKYAYDQLSIDRHISYNLRTTTNIVFNKAYCNSVTFFLICLAVSVTNIAVFSALDDILPLGPCSPGKNLLCINDGL
jgi:hypothetical protein